MFSFVFEPSLSEFELLSDERLQTLRSLKVIIFHSVSLDTPWYQYEGCFTRATTKVGVYLGTFPPISYSTVDQCAQVAQRQDFTESALFEGGVCIAGHDLQEVYNEQGTALSCKNGVGGKDSVALYSLMLRGTNSRTLV